LATRGSGQGRVVQTGFGHIGPIQETSDEHQRVSIEFPNKWKIDGSDRSDLSDGVGRWVGGRDRIRYIDEEPPSLAGTELEILLYPGELLFGLLRFDDPVEDEVAGRRCWKAEAQPSKIFDRMYAHPIFIAPRWS